MHSSCFDFSFSWFNYSLCDFEELIDGSYWEISHRSFFEIVVELCKKCREKLDEMIEEGRCEFDVVIWKIWEESCEYMYEIEGIVR